MGMRYPADGPSYREPEGVTFGGREWYELDPAEAQQAHDALMPFLEPAPDPVLAKAVGILSVRCKRRDSGPDEAKLAVQVLVQDLQELPGDVALAVLDKWSRQSAWWPTRAELLAMAGPMMAQRQFVAGRLRMAAARSDLRVVGAA